MKLVLASTSKFKSEILDKVKMKHHFVSSNYDDKKNIKDNVYEYVKKLSLGKANSINVTDCIILGLDTVLYVDGNIIEKPNSIHEAKENLKMSSGKTTSIITGIALINKYTNEYISDYQETKITLNEVDDVDLDYYIKQEPNVMYSSGFIVETVASNFIKNINGSFYNILGVPVEKIYEYLLKWNIHLKDLD